MIDYYEKYGIDRNEDPKAIKEKLRLEQRHWFKRQSTTQDEKVLEDVVQHINELDEILALYKSGHEEERRKYDAELDKQRKVRADGLRKMEEGADGLRKMEEGADGLRKNGRRSRWPSKNGRRSRGFTKNRW